MDTGIPELDMPPLDPIHIDLIDFKFFNMTIEFVISVIKVLEYIPWVLFIKILFRSSDKPHIGMAHFTPSTFPDVKRV